MRLCLGVVDVAYSDRNHSSAGPIQPTTTGDVAEILEANYHVMRIFFQENEEFIGDCLVDAMAGAIESMAMGRPVFTRDIATKLNDRVITGLSVNGKIEERFRDFLDMGEATAVSKQIVAAADAGVSHRKKSPTSQDNDPRPAFIDTGLYQASFRAWTENT